MCPEEGDWVCGVEPSESDIIGKLVLEENKPVQT